MFFFYRKVISLFGCINLYISHTGECEIICILRGTRKFLTYMKCIIFFFHLEYKNLVCLAMEVGYISFSCQIFKVNFRETLLSYVIYHFFISMHVHDQPENVKRHFFW